MASDSNSLNRTGSSRYALFLILASVIAFAVNFYFFAPDFIHWKTLYISEILGDAANDRARAALQQVDDPFLKFEGNNKVLNWRLLFPFVAHYLRCPDWLYLTIPFVGCLLVLALASHIIYCESQNQLVSVAVASLLGTTSWFIVSTGWLSYFDSWYMLALLLCMFARTRQTLVACCLLTPWVDERFILALPVLVICRAAIRSIDEERWQSVKSDATTLGLAIAPYLAIRAFALVVHGDTTTASYVREHVTGANSLWINRIWASWEGLRVCWFFVGVFVWVSTVRGKAAWNALVVLTILATLAISLVVAVDISRNVCILLPAAMAGIVLSMRQNSQVLSRNLAIVLALNLALPAHHVWMDRGWGEHAPILNMPMALRRLNNPPPIANPNSYNERGLERVRSNDFDGAYIDFTIAVRLAPGHFDAHMNLAMLEVQRNDLVGAHQHAQRALEAADSAQQRQMASEMLEQLAPHQSNPTQD